MRKSKNNKDKTAKTIFRPYSRINYPGKQVSFDIVLSPIQSLCNELMHFPIMKSVSSNDESKESRRAEINF